MTHQWKSSPYWPAKKIQQYTCSKCGLVVISDFVPSIGAGNTLNFTRDGISYFISDAADCEMMLIKPVVEA